MNFKNIAEVFNYYKDKEISEIEKRAKEINNLIDTDANADIDALNLELDGLKQAKINTLERKNTPVIIDDNLSDEVILFGNFNYMGYNLAENIAVEVSRESSFKSGLIDYRAMAIADCKPIVTEAFIKLTRAAS